MTIMRSRMVSRGARPQPPGPTTRARAPALQGAHRPASVNAWGFPPGIFSRDSVVNSGAAAGDNLAQGDDAAGLAPYHYARIGQRMLWDFLRTNDVLRASAGST